MKIWEHHVIGPIQTNCFIFGKPEAAVMVDPGGPEAPEIARRLLDEEVEIKHVLVTHGHFDHLGWAPDVQKVVEGAKVYLHESEKPTYEPFIKRMPAQFGLALEIREPDVWIKENQILDLHGLKFKIIHTPGHSPGSVLFEYITENQNDDYLAKNSFFVGDLIFQGAIGRFDLPFSDPNDMQKSLTKIMKYIPSPSKLFPGHGSLTTMENELKSNPYLQAIRDKRSFF